MAHLNPDWWVWLAAVIWLGLLVVMTALWVRSEW